MVACDPSRGLAGGETEDWPFVRGWPESMDIQY